MNLEMLHYIKCSNMPVLSSCKNKLVSKIRLRAGKALSLSSLGRLCTADGSVGGSGRWREGPEGYLQAPGQGERRDTHKPFGR